ncbi:chondroitin sulfate proteoglycan 5 isoform X1 [Myotis daubentonii]|uniref:chondroitin sulfate proteoglycan 5 isoform X1 n=1 Tax=Myotis daubentonii TaxID=98922 RepID=UPI00287329AF|nr:chondroitin sulfate proteoglycan 5 isoform X1 [Myotis daubentonii]
MGRAGGGGPGRGPPPLLPLLAATLVLVAGAAPAREAGSAVEGDEPAPTTVAWEPRANDTREQGPPGAGEEEAAWTATGGERAPGGPGVGPEDALEASAAVTGAAWLEADGAGPGAATAEAGSGDTQALPATAPAPGEAPGPSSAPPAPPAATAAGPPAPTAGHQPSPGPGGPQPRPAEVWPNPGGSAPEPRGPEPTSPLPGAPELHPGSDAIDLDYLEGLDGEGRGADLGSFPEPPGASERHPDDGGETPSWSLLDLYDDFTPFDESDFYPTTSFYDDLEEEEEEQEEEEEEGGKEAAGRGPRDGHGDLVPSERPAPGTGQPPRWWHAGPPQHTLGMAPGGSIALRPRPGEPGRDLAPGENGTACRSGFVRHNSSCRSVCDLLPSYCHNGGQCYLVEHLGAFCRCNTQDYIWHKGTRCESIVTDFQVMCVAVGAAALVLLLLFMVTVFFAKKLYLLKTENSTLRRTHKFRTPSELHNDNFSLSTIAEGSHPNDDPSAPHKIQEVLKSCLKEEEPFNIQNSLSPKLEGRGDPAELEANCLQNNLT